MKAQDHYKGGNDPSRTLGAKMAISRFCGRSVIRLLLVIVIYGVLLWGAGTAILFSLIFHLATGGKEAFLASFARSIVVFPPLGIIMGYFMWILFEKAREKARISEQRHAADADKLRR